MSFDSCYLFVPVLVQLAFANNAMQLHGRFACWLSHVIPSSLLPSAHALIAFCPGLPHQCWAGCIAGIFGPFHLVVASSNRAAVIGMSSILLERSVFIEGLTSFPLLMCRRSSKCSKEFACCTQPAAAAASFPYNSLPISFGAVAAAGHPVRLLLCHAAVQWRLQQ